MFSVLKLIGSTLWNWSTKEADPVHPVGDVPEKQIEKEQKWSLSGTVTKINHLESYGLVDNVVYFTFDTVCGSVELSVGDSVNVEATRKHSSQGWIAYSVTVLNETWEEKDSNKADCKDSAPAKTNAVSNEIQLDCVSNEVNGGTRTVNGVVTSLGETYSIMNNSILLYLKDCRENFHPVEGDSVTALLTSSEHKKVLSWWPTETRYLQGLITSYEKTCGTINSEVIFFHSSCQIDVPLSEGIEVSACAVKIMQGMYNWRATMISEYGTMEQLREKMKQMLDDKDGIVITNSLDFQDVLLSQKKHVSVGLKNALSVPQVLLSCHFVNCGSASVFYLGEGKIKTIHKENKNDLHTSISLSEETVIPPGATFILNVHCKAQTLGLHENRLVFQFKGFSVGRMVKCNVVDPVQSILKPTAPFAFKSRDEAKKMRNESLFFIPGERPYCPKGRFSKKLPLYPIPKTLWNAVERHLQITDVAPCLLEDLSKDNYVTKFKCLLHLEEIQAVLDIQEFNMPKVCLYNRGEFLSLEVPGLAEGRPSLLVGDRVMLFHPDDSVEIAYEGYVHEVLRSEVLLKFNESFHAKYNCETYDVAFQFTRTNFRRCHHVVTLVYKHNPAVIFPEMVQLKPCLVQNLPVKGSEEILSYKSPVRKDLNWINEKLNDRQKEAVRRILQGQCRPSPYIIFGPPGTGKTITLIEAVLQSYIMLKNSRIVICTPSNSAADLVVQWLLASNIVGEGEVVRLNSCQRNEESIPDFIKPLCQDKNNVRTAIKYPIIVSTCTTAGAILAEELSPGYFTHVFIDEAGQATEPEALLAVSLLSQNRGQIVLSGDPYQLGPVLRSKFSTRCGLQISYLERLQCSEHYKRNEAVFGQFGGYNPLFVTMLIESYRCQPSILAFPSKTFYFSELICSVPEERLGALNNWEMLPKQGFPIIFHGVQGEELREENSPSWFNPVEVVQVVMYLQNLYEHGLKPEQIGIITPYRKQVEKIKLLINAFSLEHPKIGSVEEFQGQERTVIIISTVRSDNDLANFDRRYNLGFLSNPKRTNVALTRAKDILIVVGDPHVLQNDYYWMEFMIYVVSHGGYAGCDLPSTLKEATDL